MRYARPEPGEPRSIPMARTLEDGIKTTYRIAVCCDCGLAHKHVFTAEPVAGMKKVSRIIERVWRDNRVTAQIRRKMAKDGDIIVEEGANVYVIMRRIRAKGKRGKVVANYEPY